MKFASLTVFRYCCTFEARIFVVVIVVAGLLQQQLIVISFLVEVAHQH